jgi:hypothetical protein
MIVLLELLIDDDSSEVVIDRHLEGWRDHLLINRLKTVDCDMKYLRSLEVEYTCSFVCNFNLTSGNSECRPGRALERWVNISAVDLYFELKHCLPRISIGYVDNLDCLIRDFSIEVLNPVVVSNEVI